MLRSGPDKESPYIPAMGSALFWGLLDGMSDELDPLEIIEAVRSECQHAPSCPVDSVLQVINRQAQAQRDKVTELRQTFAHLIRLQEEERSRIATELHDNVAQLLSAAKLTLGSNQPAVHHILDETIAAVRRLGSTLRPSLLDHVGLGAALESLVRTTREATRLDCSMHMACETDVGRDKGIALYRVCQEAITNVLRHAEATRLRVECYEDGGNVILIVTDNGTGFDPGALPKGAFGLLGIRERLRFFGGSLEIVHAEPKGTRLTVRLPLDDTVGRA